MKMEKSAPSPNVDKSSYVGKLIYNKSWFETGETGKTRRSKMKAGLVIDVWLNPATGKPQLIAQSLHRTDGRLYYFPLCDENVSFLLFP